jgi:hypothetical protein
VALTANNYGEVYLLTKLSSSSLSAAASAGSTSFRAAHYHCPSLHFTQSLHFKKATCSDFLSEEEMNSNPGVPLQEGSGQCRPGHFGQDDQDSSMLTPDSPDGQTLPE